MPGDGREKRDPNRARENKASKQKGGGRGGAPDAAPRSRREKTTEAGKRLHAALGRLWRFLPPGGQTEKKDRRGAKNERRKTYEGQKDFDLYKE